MENSVEGDGDVLRDFSSGKESNSERIVLQVALCITRLFRFSTTGQSNNPRSNPSCFYVTLIWLFDVIISA